MKPEHRIHGISHAMAVVLDVVHAGRLSYDEAERIIASLATLYDATITPRAEIGQVPWPDDAPPRERYAPPEAQRVVVYYERWLEHRTQRARAQQER